MEEVIMTGGCRLKEVEMRHRAEVEEMVCWI